MRRNERDNLKQSLDLKVNTQNKILRDVSVPEEIIKSYFPDGNNEINDSSIDDLLGEFDNENVLDDIVEDESKQLDIVKDNEILDSETLTIEKIQPIQQQQEVDEDTERLIEKLEKFTEEDRAAADELYGFMKDQITEEGNSRTAVVESLPKAIQLKIDASKNMVEVIKMKLATKKKVIKQEGNTFINTESLNIDTNKFVKDKK